MRAILTAFTALLIATSAFADDMEERRKAAVSYLNSPAQQKAIDAMFSADQMIALLKAQVPTATDEQLEIAGRIASEELNAVRGRLEEVMLEAAIKKFTLEELVALDEFYRSPIGESVMLKMADFMQQTMIAMSPDMQRMQANIARRVRTEVFK